MNSLLWSLKRKFRYYWRNHKIQVILFASTSALIILTSVIVIVVFIVTGKASLSTGRDLHLKDVDKKQLTESETKLSEERKKFTEFVFKSPGKCEEKLSSLKNAVEKDRASDISVFFLDFYECSYLNKLSTSSVLALASQLKSYGVALNEYAVLKEDLLIDNPELSDKERLSLTCRRLKSTLISFDVDLVNATITCRQGINKFALNQASNSEAKKLLSELDLNPSNPGKLSQLIDIFKMNLKLLNDYILPIVKAQDSASKALIYGYRRWKMIQKFKFAASNSSGTFKENNPDIYQELLRYTNKMFLVQQALGRLEFFIAIHTADQKFSSNTSVKSKLSELLNNPELAKLIELHHLTQSNQNIYQSHIVPIFQAYERQSRNRLLALGSRYELKFQDAFIIDPSLTEEKYRKSAGAPFWNAFLAHKFNDYQKLKDELLPDEQLEQ